MTWTGERIAIVALALVVIFEGFWIVRLYAVVALQQEQVATLITTSQRLGELLDSQNRRIATLEIKLEFCMIEVRRLHLPKANN